MTERPSPISADAGASKRGLPIWIIIVSFLGLAGFLVLLAMGVKKSNQGPVSVGQPAPTFELTLFDGTVVNTQDYLGKVVVVNFWASWCTTCELEAADLEAAWQSYQPDGKVVFLGVDYVDTSDAAQAYLEKFHITYPNGPDLGTKIAQSFRISGTPETYIIGPDGNLVYIQIGSFDSLAKIKAVIDPLLD